MISVIKDQLVLLRASIPTTIDIHTKFPDETVMILSDKIQIGQILMNLCTNASQAMEETMNESFHGTERILFVDDEENSTQMA